METLFEILFLNSFSFSVPLTLSIIYKHYIPSHYIITFPPPITHNESEIKRFLYMEHIL